MMADVAFRRGPGDGVSDPPSPNAPIALMAKPTRRAAWPASMTGEGGCHQAVSGKTSVPSRVNCIRTSVHPVTWQAVSLGGVGPAAGSVMVGRRPWSLRWAGGEPGVHAAEEVGNVAEAVGGEQRCRGGRTAPAGANGDGRRVGSSVPSVVFSWASGMVTAPNGIGLGCRCNHRRHRPLLVEGWPLQRRRRAAT